MSRNIISRHYARIIELWPKDPLRPTVSFQNALRRRIDGRSGETATKPGQVSAKVDEQAELSEINAMYLLLDNQCAKKFRTSENFYKPLSNPKYYENLVREMEEAPNRSGLGRWLNRWKGFIRWR